MKRDLLFFISGLLFLTSCSSHLAVTQLEPVTESKSPEEKTFFAFEGGIEPISGLSLNSKVMGKELSEVYRYNEYSFDARLHPFKIPLNNNLFFVPFAGIGKGFNEVTKKETTTGTRTLTCPSGNTCYTSNGGIIHGGTSKSVSTGTKTKTTTIHRGQFKSYSAGFYLTPKLKKGEFHYSLMFRISRELDKQTGLTYGDGYNRTPVDMGGLYYTLGIGIGITKKSSKNKKRK